MWYRFYKKMLNTVSVVALAVGLMSTPPSAEASGIVKGLPTTQTRKLVKKRVIKSPKKSANKKIVKSKRKASSKKKVAKGKIAANKKAISLKRKKIGLKSRVKSASILKSRLNNKAIVTAIKNVKSAATKSTMATVKSARKISNITNNQIKLTTAIKSLPIQKEAAAGVQTITTSTIEKTVQPGAKPINHNASIVSELKNIFNTTTNNQTKVLKSAAPLGQVDPVDSVSDILEIQDIHQNVDHHAGVGSQIDSFKEVAHQAENLQIADSAPVIQADNVPEELMAPQGSDIPAPPPIGGMSSQGKLISNAPQGSDIPPTLPIAGLLKKESQSKKAAELTVKKQADVDSVTQATGSDRSVLFHQIRQGKLLKKAEAALKTKTLDDQIKLGVSLKKTNLISVASEDDVQGTQSQDSISSFNDSDIIQPNINKLKSDIEFYKKNLEILQGFDDEEIIEDVKMKELKEYSSRRGTPLEDELEAYITELESKLKNEEEALKNIRLNGAKGKEEAKAREEAVSQNHVVSRDTVPETSTNKPAVSPKEKASDNVSSLQPKNKPTVLKTVAEPNRGGLLEQIKGGHALKKTVTEKSESEKPVGGRDALLENIKSGMVLKKAATKDNKQDMDNGFLASAFKKVIPVSSKKMEVTSLVDAEKALIMAQKKLNSFDRDFYDDAIEADKKEQNLKSKVAKAQETIEKFKKLPVKSNHPNQDNH